MSSPPGSFGKNLAQLRNARGISQARLAKLIGVHKMTVTKWEGGTRARPSAENVLAISRALRVPISKLLGKENPATEASIDAYRASAYWATRVEEGEEPSDVELDFLRYAIDGLWVEGEPTPKALDTLIGLARISPELVRPPQ